MARSNSAIRYPHTFGRHSAPIFVAHAIIAAACLGAGPVAADDAGGAFEDSPFVVKAVKVTHSREKVQEIEAMILQIKHADEAALAEHDLPQALASRTRMLTYTRKEFGEDHWHTTLARKYLSAYQSVAEIPEERQQQFFQAFDAMRTGNLLLHEGQVVVGMLLFQECLNHYEDVFEEDNILVAVFLEHFARQYANSREYDKAVEYLVRSLAAIEVLLGTEHPLYLSTSMQLADVLCEQGRHGEAEGIMRCAIEPLDEVVGGHSVDYILALCRLARVLNRQQRFDEAKRVAVRAVARCSSWPEHLHSLRVRSMGELAAAYRGLGRLDAAAEVYSSVTGWFTDPQCFLPHPWMVGILNEYAEVLHALDRKDDAEDVEANAQTLRIRLTQ
jgi:tetratricopeptide (TPR) repeat protein